MDERDLFANLAKYSTSGPCVIGYTVQKPDGRELAYTIFESNSGALKLALGIHQVFQTGQEAKDFFKEKLKVKSEITFNEPEVKEETEETALEKTEAVIVVEEQVLQQETQSQDTATIYLDDAAHSFATAQAELTIFNINVDENIRVSDLNIIPIYMRFDLASPMQPVF